MANSYALLPPHKLQKIWELKRRLEFRLKIMPAVGTGSRKWILLSHPIEGWLTDGEANQLFALAKYHTPRQRPVVVELGSWKGKSSVMLAGGLTRKQNARLFCIDPFGCDEDPEYQAKYYDPLMKSGEMTNEMQFRQNMRVGGVERIATPLKGYSFQFAETWTEPIDFLFIDANHEYSAVLRDFSTWSGFVKEDGVVAFHDANGSWPGPTRVVEEMLKPPDYGPVGRADSLAWAIKTRAAAGNGHG